MEKRKEDFIPECVSGNVKKVDRFCAEIAVLPYSRLRLNDGNASSDLPLLHTSRLIDLGETGRPTLFFVAGPNGSGKSTLIHSLLKEEGKIRYVCADNEAVFLLNFDAPSLEKEAWERARSLRSAYVIEKRSFVTETVFSHESHLSFLAEAKEKGYVIISFYVCVNSPSVCAERVKKRVSQGGHDVPPLRIAPRYERSLAQLPKLIELSDYCIVVDNSRHYEAVFYKEKDVNLLLKQTPWFESVRAALISDGIHVIRGQE
ncbi:MAG: AAA family ATPase [Clostridia bacterium]|nr:AAA family ATPase [Clostridia bacterium]